MQLPIFELGPKYSGLFIERDKDFSKDKKNKDNRNKTDRKNIFGDIGLSTFGIVRETTKNDTLTMELSGLEKNTTHTLKVHRASDAGRQTEKARL